MFATHLTIPLLRSGDWENEAGEAIRVEAESKNAREAVCIKGKRSVLGASKKRPFQVKGADDPRMDVIFPQWAV
jgi:hypothetical protein